MRCQIESLLFPTMYKSQSHISDMFWVLWEWVTYILAQARANTQNSFEVGAVGLHVDTQAIHQ